MSAAVIPSHGLCLARERAALAMALLILSGLRPKRRKCALRALSQGPPYPLDPAAPSAFRDLVSVFTDD